MTWVRVDDQRPINRKVAALSDAAYRLDDEAICWASRNLTDGRVGVDDLPNISRRATTKVVDELVKRGRWHPADYQCPSQYCPEPGPDGWVIHDYLEFNPTREEVITGRAAKTERQRKWRASKRGAGSASTPSTGRRATASTDDVSQRLRVDGGERLQETLPHARAYPAPPRPAPKQGAGGARPAPDGEATTGRPLPPDGAAGGRKDQNPPASPPEPPTTGQRRAQLAAAAKAAVRARPAPAKRGRAIPGPPPIDVVDNPHYDPAEAAKLGTLPLASDDGAAPTSEETP